VVVRYAAPVGTAATGQRKDIPGDVAAFVTEAVRIITAADIQSFQSFMIFMFFPFFLMMIINHTGDAIAKQRFKLLSLT
jgi:hypothetical protein